MEFTGKVVGILQNFETGQLQITFTVNEPVIIRNGYDAIKDLEKLSIKAVKYWEKRSLDANAYAWVLMSKIAVLMNTSKEEVYEEMLRRYGVLYEDEDGYVTITVKAAVDMSKIEGHWQLIKDNGTYKGYAMIKGTSQYNTKEMSCFIDGIISECKDLGIETLPQEELKRMKEEWGRENLERAHR